MSLRLRPEQVRELHAHLAAAYPEEGCGILLGREAGEGFAVERWLPLGNRSEETRGRRYLIAPEDILTAERQARDEGLDVIGFAHSHPDHPATPSAFDLEHAWPYYVYLIVSVQRGAVADAKAWRLTPDRGRFEPMTLALPSDDGPPPDSKALPS